MSDKLVIESDQRRAHLMSQLNPGGLLLHIFSLLLHVKPQGFFWLSLVGRNLPRDTNWKSTVWLGTMIQDMRSDAQCGVLKTSKVASWHEMLQAKDKSNPPSGIDLTICRQLLRICQSIPQALLNPKNKDRTQVSRLFPTGATLIKVVSLLFGTRTKESKLQPHPIDDFFNY